MTTSAADVQITVYWRPGCGFCSALRRDLAVTGLKYNEINIWDHPDAAAFVRSVANGNETVPTVTIGSTSVVNPSAEEVLELAQAAAA
jgi:mycoredoxin